MSLRSTPKLSLEIKPDLTDNKHRLPVSSVSVIIPCYNHSDTIERAIESVAQQTTRVLECIVVNDGGGTSEQRLLQLLQHRYGEDWLVVVSLRSNIGAGGARNVGWKLALGDYIAFLDADDAWHPRKIEIQYGYMLDNPDVSVCGHLHRQEASATNWELYSLTNHTTKITLANLLLSNQFITPSVMLKCDLEAKFVSSQRYMEDFRLWLTLAIQGKRIVIIGAELACIFKPQFGHSGLSAELLRMEIGEIQTYLAVCFERLTLLPLLFFLLPFSVGKFFRRLLIMIIKKT